MEGARPAVAGDLARLTELTVQAGAELGDQRGGRLLLSDSGCKGAGEWLEGYLGGGAGRSLWVGTVDDVVAGLAAISAPPAPGPGRFDALYVAPDARRARVATALLDAGVTWLRGRGCTGVDVAALPGNRATKQFLESAGLVARLIVMHRAL